MKKIETPRRARKDKEAEETLKDAEAIVRLLNSPRVPESVHVALAEAIDDHLDEYRDTSPRILAALLTEAAGKN